MPPLNNNILNLSVYSLKERGEEAELKKFINDNKRIEVDLNDIKGIELIFLDVVDIPAFERFIQQLEGKHLATFTIFCWNICEKELWDILK